MVVGVLQVELAFEGAQSLKDKRRVISSLKDRLFHRHRVSVAEVGALDNHQLAILGVTMASNSVPHCQSVLDHVLGRIREHRGCVINDHRTEILGGQ